jgi:hypothetical protein
MQRPGTMETAISEQGRPMAIELDHLFVCTDRGAPGGDQLRQFGLHEGSPNHHPGQGTANRRFPFLNAMIELVWVEDPAEAQSEATRRTLLWERWSRRDGEGCPFGICVRPARASRDEVPFPAWAYKPSYLSSPLAMHIGEAGLEEPMWVYLGFLRRPDREKHFQGHPIGIREITGLRLETPSPLTSEAAQAVNANGILSSRPARLPLLEVEFDRCRQQRSKDFRPHLPLVFRF